MANARWSIRQYTLVPMKMRISSRSACVSRMLGLWQRNRVTHGDVTQGVRWGVYREDQQKQQEAIGEVAGQRRGTLLGTDCCSHYRGVPELRVATRGDGCVCQNVVVAGDLLGPEWAAGCASQRRGAY